MRLVLIAAAGIGVLAVPAGASQQADVDSYLCTFAGKCGDAAASVPTKAAPATKGFRLAQAATPTVVAPQTKGFRLAQATSTQAVPAMTGSRPAHVARAGRAVPVRHLAAARPAPVPGQTRANLMLAFNYNSAQMTPAAEAKAKVFAQALMNDALKQRRFLIEGHTDVRGQRDANLDLSRRRAQSVADYLVAQGVDA